MATKKEGYDYIGGNGLFLGDITPTKEKMASLATSRLGELTQDMTNEQRDQYSNTLDQMLGNYAYDNYWQSTRGYSAFGGDSTRFTSGNLGQTGAYFDTEAQLNKYLQSTGSLGNYGFAGVYVKDVNRTYYNLSEQGAKELGLYDQIVQGIESEKQNYESQKVAYEQKTLAQVLQNERAARESEIQSQKAVDDAYIRNAGAASTSLQNQTTSGRRRASGVSTLTDQQALGGNTLLGA